ncbi:hypothetical protein HG530_004936 [Fusarium avenaceum]|nr:hypothetical protein HG530_004936 [Fusarium avenaceum]
MTSGQCVVQAVTEATGKEICALNSGIGSHLKPLAELATGLDIVPKALSKLLAQDVWQGDLEHLVESLRDLLQGVGNQAAVLGVSFLFTLDVALLSNLGDVKPSTDCHTNATSLLLELLLGLGAINFFHIVKALARLDGEEAQLVPGRRDNLGDVGQWRLGDLTIFILDLLDGEQTETAIGDMGDIVAEALGAVEVGEVSRLVDLVNIGLFGCEFDVGLDLTAHRSKEGIVDEAVDDGMFVGLRLSILFRVRIENLFVKKTSAEPLLSFLGA